MRRGGPVNKRGIAYCVDKIRDGRGNIIEYVLVNEYGTQAIFDKKHMAMELRNKNAEFEIINLQIDTLGRIVDKAVPKETIQKFKNHSKVNNKQSIFEEAYSYMINNNLIIMICFNKNSLDLTEPFNRLQNINISNIETLEKEFESYMLQRHNFKASKLKIINKSKQFMFIMWSTAYMDSYQFHNYHLEYDNIDNFNITYQPNSNTFEKYQKVATVYDKSTGKVVENAFCGIVAYDKTNAEAVEEGKKRIRDMDAAVRAISRTAPNKGNNRVTLDKGNGRVTLAKSNSVRLNKINNRKKSFILFDLFRMFRR